ncbi:hypothetical protein [Roseiconus lacunae]|uniref:hypothetical protein n=1 Tax=Roseiconus lacunae TaxID=2605694 RepID=UPI001E4869E7|nr:hypothetical protein [Roseiconus lacunae]MCD0460059.1 hypothetical protein [Roseiconus lacunae]
MTQRTDGPTRNFSAGEDLDANLLLKLDGSGDAILCDAGETPIGSNEYSVQQGATVAVELNNAPGTRILTLSGTGAALADVYPANDGKVSTTQSASEPPYGQLLQSGADGEYVEVLPYLGMKPGA